MKREKRIVTTTFYADGKSVWLSEYPTQLSDEQIKTTVEEINKRGYGIVDTLTDSTGRLVKV